MFKFWPEIYRCLLIGAKNFSVFEKLLNCYITNFHKIEMLFYLEVNK